MNSKKLWSILLLIAMSYSLMHDYTFNILHDEQHTVKEYISELTTPSINEDICDAHFQYHATYLFPIKFVYLSSIIREEILFTHNKVFISRDYFNFFKPPIA